MYIFLCSDVQKKVYPGNTSTNFYVDIANPLYCSPKTNYEIALIQMFFYVKPGNAPDTLPIVEFDKPLCVFCDLVESSFVFDKNKSVLRIVNEVGEYLDPFYMTLSRDYISRIHVYIKTLNNEFPQYDDYVLRCALHLKEK